LPQQKILHRRDFPDDFSLTDSLLTLTTVCSLSLPSYSQDLIHQGIEAFKIAAEMAYQVKPKRSWKNVLFKPDYNAYTDEEIMAEIVYCSAFGAIGGLTLLSDKSYRGLLTAAVHFNKAYKLYFEALNIAKYRKKWQHPISQQQFEMGLKLSLGVSSMVFSFAPAKIAKLLTMVGISTDLEKALKEIHDVCDSRDPLFFIPSSMALLGFYGLLEPVYGVGESRKDLCVLLADKFVNCDFYGNLRYFVLGARETILGNLESAIAYEYKTRDSLSYLGNTTVVTSVFNMLNFGLTGQLDKAIECLELFDKMKVKAYLPSFLVYIHASVLRMQMDDGRPELEEAVSNKLREIKQTRGFFVLKKVFYEKMIETRAQQYVNDIKGWLLPVFEILYIGNFLYVIEGKHKYIDPMMDKVDKNLKALAKNDIDYWDKYAYLLFYKAFFLKLGGNSEDALSYFHEILSLESIIERETQLVPQTCYEIGLIHRKNKKTAEAKRWLNKANKYTDYITEFLLQWRCRYALDHMTPMEYTIPETMTHLPL
jgi:tetratricopeptide (TPR) repeat protein